VQRRTFCAWKRLCGKMLPASNGMEAVHKM
jgi:hypothetical protein